MLDTTNYYTPELDKFFQDNPDTDIVYAVKQPEGNQVRVHTFTEYSEAVDKAKEIGTKQIIELTRDECEPSTAMLEAMR